MNDHDLPEKYDVEDAKGPSSKEINKEGGVDLKQRGRDFSIEEMQARTDSLVRLSDARAKQIIAYMVPVVLILLIVCGLVIFLNKGGIDFLLVILGQVETLVAAVIAYFFGMMKKRE